MAVFPERSSNLFSESGGIILSLDDLSVFNNSFVRSPDQIVEELKEIFQKEVGILSVTFLDYNFPTV